MDLRDQCKTMIDALGALSALARLRDMVAYARKAETKRCGACDYWMKSRDCPREHNVNGYSRGPSMDAHPCQKWKANSGYAELIAKRRNEANEFAERCDFPVPFPTPNGGDRNGE